jgi:hypothetical protein
MVLTLSFASAVVGIWIKKTGKFREAIWFGLVFMTLGNGLFINLPPHKNWAKIIIYQIILGLGVGPNFQSPLIALQSRLKGHDVAVGTATFGSTRNLATSISIVLGGVVFQNELQNHKSTLVSALGPQLGNRLATSSFGATASQLSGLTPEQKDVLDKVYTDSLQKLWIFYTAFSAFGILISLFVKKQELSREKFEVKTGLAEQERVRVLENEEQKLRRDAKHNRGESRGTTKDVEKAAEPAQDSPVGGS